MVDAVCLLNGALNLPDEVGQSVLVVMMGKDDGFDTGMDVRNMASLAAFGIESEVGSEEQSLEISDFGRHKKSVAGWSERIKREFAQKKKKVICA